MPNVKAIGVFLPFRRETLHESLHNISDVRVILIKLVSRRRTGLVKEKLETKTTISLFFSWILLCYNIQLLYYNRHNTIISRSVPSLALHFMHPVVLQYIASLLKPTQHNCIKVSA
jgi:hypothetical protein